MKTLKYLMVALLVVVATSCKKETVCPDKPAVSSEIILDVLSKDVRQADYADPGKTSIALAAKRHFKTDNVADSKLLITVDGKAYYHQEYSNTYIAEVLPDEGIEIRIVLTKK